MTKSRVTLLAALLLIPACKDEPSEPAAAPPATVTNSATNAHHHEHHAHGDHQTLPADPPAGGSLHQLDLELTDHNGATLTWKEFAGAPLLVAIIYTSCTTACPMIVSEIKEIRKEAGTATRVLLVSMDTVNDDRSALKAMHDRHALDENWSVAQTSDGSLRELAAALGVRYRKLPDGSFNHSQVITALGPDGVIIARAEGLGPQRADVVAVLRPDAD